jgi:hypothetical protein
MRRRLVLMIGIVASRRTADKLAHISVYPFIPARAGTQEPHNESLPCGPWIPACAGMNGKRVARSQGYGRHREERSDEAIQGAYAAPGLLRFARNDGAACYASRPLPILAAPLFPLIADETPAI